MVFVYFVGNITKKHINLFNGISLMVRIFSVTASYARFDTQYNNKYK